MKDCWSCRRPIDAPDRFCRHCGMGQGDDLHWYYRPAWIAVLALVAVGPLVLPLVWRTPRLGPRGRWVLTVLVLLYTLNLVYGLIRAIALFRMLMGA